VILIFDVFILISFVIRVTFKGLTQIRKTKNKLWKICKRGGHCERFEGAKLKMRQPKKYLGNFIDLFDWPRSLERGYRIKSQSKGVLTPIHSIILG